MKTYPKKRIEVIIEAPLLRRTIDHLDKAGVSGYSVMPIVAGRGHERSWTVDGEIGNAAQMVALVCITDESRLDEVMSSIFGVISHQIGFVTISDVFVVRRERF